jgi:hypothetical protein
MASCTEVIPTVKGGPPGATVVGGADVVGAVDVERGAEAVVEERVRAGAPWWSTTTTMVTATATKSTTPVAAVTRRSR